MTPKIIAHNEELQRIEKGKTDQGGFDPKARSDAKTRTQDFRRTDELGEHRFKSSEGYYPSQYQGSKPFYPESYASTANSHPSSHEQPLTVHIPARMQSFGRPGDYEDSVYPRPGLSFPGPRASLPEAGFYPPAYPLMQPHPALRHMEMLPPPAPVMASHPTAGSYLYYPDSSAEASPHLPNRGYFEGDDADANVPDSPAKETSDIVRKVVDYLDL